MLSNFISKNRNTVFLIPFFIYSISLFNSWYLADDHEISLFASYIKNHSFWHTIQITEVGQWGVYKRFRPIYFPIRIIESWIWGDKLYFWYFTRLVIQFFFLREVYLWAKQKLTLNESVITTLIVLSMLFWRDLETRLGPGEHYCILGLILISVSLRLNKFKFLYFLGSLIAMGSKENFVILPFLLVFYQIGFKKISVSDLIYNFILACFASFIALGIYKAVSHSGADIYMTKVDPLSRSLALLRGFFTIQIVPYFILGFLWLKKKITLQRNEWTILVIIGIVLVSNIIFYNGEIPRGNRYDFPAVPLNIIVWIILYQKYPLPEKGKRILALFLAFFISSGIYRQTTKAVSKYKETHALSDRLQAILKKSKKGTPIVLVTSDASDNEVGMIFIPRLLRHYGYDSKIFFKTLIPNEADPLKKELKSQMDDASKNGMEGIFSPLSELDGPCLQVNLTTKTKETYCQDLMNF